MPAYARIVDKSAKLLDKEIPEWEKLIDVDTLDMLNNCLVNQLQEMDRGNDLFQCDDKRGFDVGDGYKQGDYEKLTNLWKKQIQKRLHSSESKQVHKVHKVHKNVVLAIDFDGGYAFFPSESELKEPLKTALFGSYKKKTVKDLNNDCKVSGRILLTIQ